MLIIILRNKILNELFVYLQCVSVNNRQTLGLVLFKISFKLIYVVQLQEDVYLMMYLQVKSLIKNSRGPKLEPCGIPDGIWGGAELKADSRKLDPNL